MNTPRALTDRETEWMLRALAPHHRRAAAFALCTGLRLRELLSLTCADVAHVNVRRQIIIHETLIVRAETAKGGRRRVLPLSRDARAIVKPLVCLDWIRGRGPLWRRVAGLYRCRHVPISRRGFQAAMTRAGREVGIVGRVSPHILRHTFATRLVRAGVSLRAVQTLLGHRSLTTTQVYTHVDPAELATAVELLPRVP